MSTSSGIRTNISGFNRTLFINDIVNYIIGVHNKHGYLPDHMEGDICRITEETKDFDDDDRNMYNTIRTAYNQFINDILMNSKNRNRWLLTAYPNIIEAMFSLYSKYGGVTMTYRSILGVGASNCAIEVDIDGKIWVLRILMHSGNDDISFISDFLYTAKDGEISGLPAILDASAYSAHYMQECYFRSSWAIVEKCEMIDKQKLLEDDNLDNYMYDLFKLADDLESMNVYYYDWKDINIGRDSEGDYVLIDFDVSSKPPEECVFAPCTHERYKHIIDRNESGVTSYQYVVNPMKFIILCDIYCIILSGGDDNVYTDLITSDSVPDDPNEILDEILKHTTCLSKQYMDYIKQLRDTNFFHWSEVMYWGVNVGVESSDD